MAEAPSSNDARSPPDARHGTILILGLWALLYAWRPLALGLYCDDWDTVSAPWTCLWKAQLERPTADLLFSLLRCALGARPWAWQAFCALASLAAALSLRLLVQCLFKDPKGGKANPEADAAALAWLAFPWLLGSTAWLGACVNMLSLPLCCLGTCALLEAQGRVRRLAGGFLLLLAGLLDYETFVLTPALLLAWKAWRQRPEKPDAPTGRSFLYAGLAALLSDGIAVCYNRSAALWGWGSQSKVLHPHWLGLAVQNLRAIKDLPRSFGAAGLGMMPALVLLLAAALWAAWSRRRLGKLLAELCFVAAGLCLSCCLYAIAGYHLAPVGLQSRTSLGASLWVALLLALCARSLIQAGPKARLVLLAAGAVFLASAAASTLGALDDWRWSWARQQEILADARKTPGLDALPSGDMLVVDLPPPKGQIPDFSVYWDISGALKLNPPFLKSPAQAPAAAGAPPLFTPGAGYPATTAKAWSLRTLFTGTEIIQTPCAPGAPLWRLPARGAWVWTPDRGLLRPLKKGESCGCEG